MSQKTCTPTPPTWAQRPVFRENQRLTPERLNRILESQSQRLRMSLLGVAGTGVVYGFRIGPDPDAPCQTSKGTLQVSCGLAIDCFGRQLYWPGGDLEIGTCWLCGEKPDKPGFYTLQIHYAEQHGNGQGSCEANGNPGEWVTEGVVFSLVRVGDTGKQCCDRCKTCPPNSCPDDACVDVCGYACGRSGSSDTGCVKPASCLDNLCATPPALCKTECRDGWFYDAVNAVALACVEICDRTEGNHHKCGPALEFCPPKTDVCHQRQYVYRNPLLHELIMGCHRHFPRVENVRWQETEGGVAWEPPRPIGQPPLLTWHDFSTLVKGGSLSIQFSKPILIATLHPLSVLLTIFMQERRTDYWEGRRVPLEIIHTPPPAGSNATDEITLAFPPEWVDAEIEDSRSSLMDGCVVELTIRGAMLRDGCGNMLDAVPLGYAGTDYRQEMLGDDFVVAFHVDGHIKTINQDNGNKRLTAAPTAKTKAIR